MIFIALYTNICANVCNWYYKHTEVVLKPVRVSVVQEYIMKAIVFHILGKKNIHT